MLHIDWSSSHIDVNTFLRDYWQKKPLLIKGGLVDFQPDITPDDLAGLACEEDIESRIVIEHGETPWQLLRGPFSDETFADLPESHWTLLVQSVDIYHPDVANLLDAFRFIPNWRLDDVMISFAVQGGSVGPHFDQYDVFLVQGSGTREWQVGLVCDANSPRIKGTPLHILAGFTATDVHVCEAGDILYIPPGYSHFGIAQQECMTFSVGFRAPSLGQLLDQFAHHVGAQSDANQRFTDSDRTLGAAGAIQSSDIATVRHLISSALADDAAIAGWFGRFMTECKHPIELLDEPLQANEVAGYLSEFELTFVEGSRLAYFEDKGVFTLFANGEIATCPNTPIELQKRLADRENEAFMRLKESPEEYAQLIANLVNVGVFSIE